MIDPEDKSTLRDKAAAAWLRCARKAGNPYIDRIALVVVRDQVVEALIYEDADTIISAIEQRMDQESSPRRIPEWARLQGNDERELARSEQLMREREEHERIVDHEGTLYLGHVPHAVGDRCSECGKTAREHQLARPPALRHIGEAAEAVKETLRP